MAAAVGSYWRGFGRTAARLPQAGLPLYEFYPLAGTLYADLFTNNFVDLDPSSALLDWDCTDFTKNGHDASDVDLRSFGEQLIGIPIFAALDGTVVATHDGEPDMNQCPGSPCSSTANRVVIDHGNGRMCYYWHMKQGSVAVSVSQNVRAGEQIGLAGSSGNSSQPHLHFATYDDGSVYEPYAGACRSGPSGWAGPQTPIERSLYLRDFGITYEDMNLYPGYPAEFPRSGQIATTDAFVYLWALPINLPASSTWRLQFRRPNGTIAFDTGINGFGNPFERWSWWWWNYNIADMHSITGTWNILFYLNSTLMVTAPIEVRTARTPDFNHAPEPITVSLDPAAPTVDDALVCRVATSLTLDDLDYEIVRYEYVWTVEGTEVRRVITAAHSDMVPHHTACPGQTIQCTVTPGDGQDDGPPTLASASVVASGFTPSDLDRSGSVDIDDYALFSDCFAGPGNPPAAACVTGVYADLDCDGDVDVDDFAEFQDAFGG